jgi:hypothetical protein
MAYLEPSEYITYCGDTPVTEADIKYATGLINAIIGRSLEPDTTVELVKLKKSAGKLKNTPVISVGQIVGVNITSYGVTESDLPLNSIYITDEYGRFAFFPGVGINSIVWGTPSNLKITYNYGFEEIPEEIKVVCGSIAKNIVKIDSIGGISGAKSISSLDFTIAMFDDRLYSSNEMLILQKYKGV